MLLKKGQYEYEAFKIWYEEGSTIAQRMISANAEPPKPPEIWFKYRQIFRALGMETLPPTMQEAAKIIASAGR